MWLNPIFPEMKLHSTALLPSAPSLPLSFPPSKEKGKRKPRMEESRTGELSSVLDLICSHLIRKLNLMG